MSNVHRIKIPRASDRTVVDCFVELGRRYSAPLVNVVGLGFAQISNVDLTKENNSDFEALLKHDSALLSSMSMRIGGLSITYARGGQYAPEQQLACPVIFGPAET